MRTEGVTSSLIQVSDCTVQQLIERGKKRKKEGGIEVGRDVSPPPRPVSHSQRGRTTGHNGALQRLAESCNLA